MGANSSSRTDASLLSDEDAMETEVKKKYCNITRAIINLYLSKCDQCQLKKQISKPRPKVEPFVSECMNSRCLIDFIDMQSKPDNENQFIMIYQDNLTKFTILRPLKTKTSKEVAYVLADIFSLFSAPCIMQCYDEPEFNKNVIESLETLWPDLKIVLGKSNPSESEGFGEESNQDIFDMLVAWMDKNGSSKWSEGLRFIQNKINGEIHRNIKKSPHEAMFGRPKKMGLANTTLSDEICAVIETEETLLELLLLQAREYNDQVNNDDDKDVDEQFPETEIMDVDDTSQESENIPIDDIQIEEPEIGEPGHIQVKQNKKNQPNIPSPSSSTSDLTFLPDFEYEHFSKEGEKERESDPPTAALTLTSDLLSFQDIKIEGLTEVVEHSEDEPQSHSSNQQQNVPSTSLSMLSGFNPSFIKCRCKRYCIDKKCKCRSKNLKCNPKCHKKLSCKNK